MKEENIFQLNKALVQITDDSLTCINVLSSFSTIACAFAYSQLNRHNSQLRQITFNYLLPLHCVPFHICLQKS